MTTNIAELLDGDELSTMLEEGFIRDTTSADGRYSILNYTEKAQYDAVWNPSTLACRGLIIDKGGFVVARPLPKFFNLSEHERESVPDLDTSGPVVVTDKLDGSLGILYRHGDELRIATRGAFESDQAKHATAVLNDRYEDFEPMPGWTHLFEIIYPQNRIVVDYGDVDDLFLLGAVHVATGRFQPAEFNNQWWGPKVERFAYESITEAIAAPDRPGREGLVVWFCDSNQRVKLKQEEYILLHRLITGLNERTIWELCAAGTPLDEILMPLPEEFHEWATEVHDRLTDAYDHLMVETVRLAREASALHDPKSDRKAFAQYVIANAGPNGSFVFAHVDGKDCTAKAWASLKPEAGLIPAVSSEETP